jgi:TyrR family helix-turn-helix protein
LPAFLQDETGKAKAVALNGLVPYKKAIEDLEFQLFSRALQQYGSTRKAAAALGVNQSTVVRKLSQYNISKADAPEHQDEPWEHRLRI